MGSLADFSGHTALITGAGDGIGAMLARQLAAAGLRVIVQDIRLEAAEKVAEEIGRTAIALQADVSDRDSLAASVEYLQAQNITLNLLWLNAGVGVGAPVLEGKANAIEWGFSVNVLGVIWSMQAYWPLLKDSAGRKHVGFTASSASLVPPDGDFPLYALTKHGTYAVAETLSGELNAKGVESTILFPGLLNTDIWDGARARPERYGGIRRMDPSIAGRWRAAKHPDAMWPYIAETVGQGGGHLVCPTEADLIHRFDARHEAVREGFHLLD